MSEAPRPIAYLVMRGDVYGQFGAEYLRLEGPFQYPRWSSVVRNAQEFTKKKAFQWAALENARVVGLLPDGRLYGSVFASGGEPAVFDPSAYTIEGGVLRTPGVRIEEVVDFEWK